MGDAVAKSIVLARSESAAFKNLLILRMHPRISIGSHGRPCQQMLRFDPVWQLRFLAQVPECCDLCNLSSLVLVSVVPWVEINNSSVSKRFERSVMIDRPIFCASPIKSSQS